MKLKAKEGYDFSPETVERKRKFPALGTAVLSILIIAQIVCLLTIFLYQPKPQDVIENYTVYATPKSDGTLDIEYRFTWTALDPNEDLTWVEIGMANEDFTVLNERSTNISKIEKYTDESGYCYAQIYFKSPYTGGSTVNFHFKVNQKRLLATDGVETFYEFIPGWFNSTQTKQYSFNFYKYGDIASFNGNSQSESWLTWSGSLDYGEFVKMRVNYNVFNAYTVRYEPFDDGGAYNDLASEKGASTVFMILLIALAAIIELSIVDAYVSYSRGRGFLRGHGHPIHVYGRINPRYEKELAKRSGGRGGGFSGGGCACACACACAGGGRAGCSQKDTYPFPQRKRQAPSLKSTESQNPKEP